MASVLTQNPYTSQPHLFTHSPYSSPSPPVSEDPGTKRLPSIQSLIEMSDPDTPSQECKSLLAPESQRDPILTIL